MNYGTVKDRIIKLALREGDDEFSALVETTINSVQRIIESEPSSLIPELVMMDSNFFYMETIESDTYTDTDQIELDADYKEMIGVWWYANNASGKTYRELNRKTFDSLLMDRSSNIGSEGIQHDLSTTIINKSDPKDYTIYYDNSDSKRYILMKPYPTASKEYTIVHSYYKLSDDFTYSGDEWGLAKYAPDILIYGVLLILTEKMIYRSLALSAIKAFNQRNQKEKISGTNYRRRGAKGIGVI